MGKSCTELVTMSSDHLETLKRCGGYYKCPKDNNGKRLGPLVGYAGKYQDDNGAEKHWVGEIYANFAKAEEYPHILYHYAIETKIPLDVLKKTDTFCGAPIGGYDFSKMLGLAYDLRAIKAEKKVTALATDNSREQSIIIFARHEVKSGEKFTIVEDVCNNFSTTELLIDLIEKSGGHVTAIACLLNRSLTVESIFKTKNGQEVPVISLVRLPIQEYKQNDPYVSEDVKNNNIVWKPKDEWNRLMNCKV